MWLDAPASSSAPHFDGHHVSPEALVALAPPAVVCAWATVIGAEPNLPKAAPARRGGDDAGGLHEGAAFRLFHVAAGSAGLGILWGLILIHDAFLPWPFFAVIVTVMT